MKKKFLSVFVACALVATMFSTTLAFAEPASSEPISDVVVLYSPENESNGITGLIVAWATSISGEVTFTYTAGGKVIKSDTFNYNYEESQFFLHREGADSVSLKMTDEEGKKIYEGTFPIPGLIHVSNFKFTRTAQNEIEVSFTSDKAGEIWVDVSLEEDGQMMGHSFHPVVVGDNVVKSPLIYTDATQFHTNDSMYGLFKFVSFRDGGRDIVWMPEVVIPAFVPSGESTTILPSTTDSDKFTWTGKGEASFSLDANKEDFLELYEGDKKNNKKIDKANYTVTAGSTIITLKEDYVKTLGNGTYLYTAEFKDGDAALKLVVDTDGAKSIVPKTSDANRTAGIIVLLTSLALATLSFRAWRKEQTKA